MPRLTDHEAIRQWTIARGGRPVVQDFPQPTGGSNEVLRLVFPQPGAAMEMNDDATLMTRRVEWSEWLALLDDKDLAVSVPEGDDLAATHEIVSRN